MKPLRVETISIQNWSCHGCTACCREFMTVEISVEEKLRIEKQNWSVAAGVDPTTIFIAAGEGYRLGHQSTGACVFLDEAGRCRIHGRFGEAAKPRACRVFPFALHPVGNKIVAGIRFNCPSATANSGKPLPQQLPALTELAALVVPDGFAELKAPAVWQTSGLEWPDFLRYVTCLDKLLAPEKQSVSLKLRRALRFLQAVEKAGFDQVGGKGGDEILAALPKNAATEVPATATSRPPTALGRLLFRTLVFNYARRDTVFDGQTRLGSRWKRLKAAFRFAVGSGHVPEMIPNLQPVDFADIEKSFGLLSSGAEGILTRFFRVKIQSLAFCGRAYYDLPLIEGFHHLALLFPVVCCLARWMAAGQGRSDISEKDVEQALVLADQHHGYSPILGSNGARRRVTLMAGRDDISRLCAAYER